MFNFATGRATEWADNSVDVRSLSGSLTKVCLLAHITVSGAFGCPRFYARLRRCLHYCTRARLFPHLDLVPMPFGAAVCEPGMIMRHVYFQTNCIVSLQYMMENGASAEIAVVGNEGIVGVSLFMGGETTTSRAGVRSAGHAFVIWSVRSFE